MSLKKLITQSLLASCIDAWAALLVGLLIVFFIACSSSMPRFENPTETCASALAFSRDIQEQARKVSLEPLELAREVCETALLAAKIGAANVASEFDAGAP